MGEEPSAPGPTPTGLSRCLDLPGKNNNSIFIIMIIMITITMIGPARSERPLREDGRGHGARHAGAHPPSARWLYSTPVAPVPGVFVVATFAVEM